MEGGAQFVDFMDKATELRLGLPGSDTAMEKPVPQASVGVKRSLPEDKDENLTMNKSRGHEAAPPAKTQVVGWPPIRSYRKNSLQAKKTEAEAGGLYVKVSMDGAPYLRKIDLKVFKGYKELIEALEVMFKCFSLGELLGMEKCSKSDYAIAYEDKDGDWMLAGDVPWEMFTSSCKRLRIMKGSEAKGLGSGQ